MHYRLHLILLMNFYPNVTLISLFKQIVSPFTDSDSLIYTDKFQFFKSADPINYQSDTDAILEFLWFANLINRPIPILVPYWLWYFFKIRKKESLTIVEYIVLKLIYFSWWLRCFVRSNSKHFLVLLETVHSLFRAQFSFFSVNFSIYYCVNKWERRETYLSHDSSQNFVIGLDWT